MRFRLPSAALCCAMLCASPAFADAKVDDAIKTIKSIAGDSAKMKTFCEMLAMVEAGEGNAAKDAEIDAKIDGYLDTLGTVIATAWDVGDELDPATPEGKAFDAAIAEVDAKCPK